MLSYLSIMWWRFEPLSKGFIFVGGHVASYLACMLLTLKMYRHNYETPPWIKSTNRLRESTRTLMRNLAQTDSWTHARLRREYKMGYLVMCEFLWLWNEDSVAHSTLRLRKQVTIFLDQSIHWNKIVTCWIKRFSYLNSLNDIFLPLDNLFLSLSQVCFLSFLPTPCCKV